MFYVYCGTETRDAVAIDNLRLSSKQSTETSTSTSCQTAWMLIKDSVTSASSTSTKTESPLSWSTTTTAPTTPSLGTCNCPTLCPSCYLPIHPNACVSKYNTCYGGFLYPQVCLHLNARTTHYLLTFRYSFLLTSVRRSVQIQMSSILYSPVVQVQLWRRATRMKLPRKYYVSVQSSNR